MNGYTELLLSEKIGPLTPQQKTVLGQMQSSGTRLANYIDDSLTLHGLKAHRFSPVLQSGSIQKCVEELQGFWKLPFEQRSVKLQVEFDSAIPEFRFDWHKTQRVLSNLLENALRYSPVGSTITLRGQHCHWDRQAHGTHSVADFAREGSDAPNAVKISISDQGPGIPPEHYRDIFTEHFRIAGDDHKSGTGLGLAIARHLVTAMRGRIWVETGSAHGSIFNVLLPTR